MKQMIWKVIFKSNRKSGENRRQSGNYMRNGKRPYEDCVKEADVHNRPGRLYSKHSKNKGDTR